MSCTSEQIVLQLLRKAFDKDFAIDFSLFAQAKWADVLDVATYQGVLGVCFDAVEMLEASCRPDMDNLMDWLGQVSFMEQQYEAQDEIISELTKELQEAGIDILILKGQPLSKYYPIPKHRPVGDIDVFAFDYYDKVNTLMESNGISIDYEEEKHAVFYYKGIMVENHKTLFNVKHSKIESETEKLVCKNRDEQYLTKEGYYVLDPLSNYIFLLRHLSKHFGDNEGITLRQIVDFGLYLNGNRTTINREQARAIISKMKLIDLNNIFTSIALDITGVDLSWAIFGEIKSEAKERIFEDIFLSYRDKEYPTGFAFIIEKIRDLHAQKWKYDLLPESYFSRIRRAWRKNIN